MAVKIQFTTELDDVPYEVSRLIESVRTNTYNACDQLIEAEFALRRDIIELKDLQSHLEKLKNFITVGIKSLTRIEDAMSILVGFYQVKTTPQSIPLEPTTEQPELTAEEQGIVDDIESVEFDDPEQYEKDHKEEFSDS